MSGKSLLATIACTSSLAVSQSLCTSLGFDRCPVTDMLQILTACDACHNRKEVHVRPVREVQRRLSVNICARLLRFSPLLFCSCASGSSAPRPAVSFMFSSRMLKTAFASVSWFWKAMFRSAELSSRVSAESRSFGEGVASLKSDRACQIATDGASLKALSMSSIIFEGGIKGFRTECLPVNASLALSVQAPTPSNGFSHGCCGCCSLPIHSTRLLGRLGTLRYIVACLAAWAGLLQSIMQFAVQASCRFLSASVALVYFASPVLMIRDYWPLQFLTGMGCWSEP